jgi:crotonobetainyl-CoA:carnitine CoA-transferase CaiB-like acyl-CoA transferase
MALADLGADVIKVELPSGDLSRAFPPFIGEESAFFLAMNRGKRSVALHPRHPEARRWLVELVRTADVLVHNLRHGAMERMGLGESDVRKINPTIVYAEVSAFGTQGPDAARPGIDLVFQAESGMVSIAGHPGDPPQKTATTVGDFLAGTNIAFLICAALVERVRTGQGKKVAVSLRDGLIAAQATWNAITIAQGGQPPRLGTASPFTAPNQIFQARDGFLALAIVADAHFRSLCEVISRPDLADRYPTNPQRVAYRDELAKELETIFAAGDVDQWTTEIKAAGVPVGKVLTLPEVMQDPQALHQEMFYQETRSDLGTYSQTGSPFRVDSESARSHNPAPALGQHTAEVLVELGATPLEIAELVAEGAAAHGTEATPGG